jgi:SAM-dependent methyltransferase
MFTLDENTKILDLGAETGSHMHNLLEGTSVNPANVYAADIDPMAIAKARERFGFVPVLIGESDSLPFPDAFFDILYCSSVIEHVTVPKDEVWSVSSGSRFGRSARNRQMRFAAEIRRLAKQYFVQTPYKHFPIESHSWLPFLSWVPRALLLPLLRFTNSFWIKRTNPDWYLLDKRQLSDLFEDAQIFEERFLGLTKSIIAVRTTAQPRAK